MAVIMGSGLLFYILLGFRYSTYPTPLTAAVEMALKIHPDLSLGYHATSSKLSQNTVGFRVLGFRLKILHDLNVLQYYNSQGIRYLGSCRMFRG